MARRRVDNRERSLGYSGFVTPVFTKESKPLGKKEKITRALRDCDTRTYLKKNDSPAWARAIRTRRFQPHLLVARLYFFCFSKTDLPPSLYGGYGTGLVIKWARIRILNGCIFGKSSQTFA
ncbi:hypothetical protein TNCV_1736011 [Trichonephila clavipes]|nr:hypothetical protein TNCV_1736011 [Trichonephila clavipes]